MTDFPPAKSESSILVRSLHAADELASPIQEIVNFARRRVDEIEQNQEKKGRVAFVILEGNPKDFLPENHPGPIRHFLKDSGQKINDGCFAIGFSARHAWKITDQFETLDGLFDCVNNIGIEKATTVIIDFKAGEMELLLGGLEGEDETGAIPISNSQLTKEWVKDNLERCEKRYFPRMSSKEFWQNPDTWTALKRLEALIQNKLVPCLSFAVPDHIEIVTESTTTEGRADIFLLPKDGGARGLLELKALRDKSASADKPKDIFCYTESMHKNSVEEGIQQAYAYREDYNSAITFLVVFDACKNGKQNLKTTYLPKCVEVGVELSWIRLVPTKPAQRQNDHPIKL